MKKTELSEKVGKLIERYVKQNKYSSRSYDDVTEIVGDYLIYTLAITMHDEGYTIKQAQVETKSICDAVRKFTIEEFKRLKK